MSTAVEASAIPRPSRRPARRQHSRRCSRHTGWAISRCNNRLVLSPMTRSRALEGNVPNPLAATYYAQRASAGLMITEGTQVSPQGVGYIRTPGIHSPEQVAGWKHVTDAVHRVGGTIFAQLWHVGRVSHPDFHNGALPVAPSALPVEGEAFTNNGKVKIATPRALETSEMPRHRRAIPQRRPRTPRPPASTASSCTAPTATCSTSSCATAPTGAPMPTAAASANRARFPLEVTEAVIGGLGRGPRRLQALALLRRLLDVGLQSDRDVHLHRAANWASCGSAICTSSEAIAGPMGRRPAPCGSRRCCATSFDGALMVNGGYDATLRQRRDRARRSRPGGVRRAVPRQSGPAGCATASSAALNAPDQATFYAGEEKGYIDYPALA